jgi:hypothetical protein
MATTPYIPIFPYTGNQIILSSGRVVLHSKDDSVMIFGKKSIGLSSTGTVNLDVSTKVIINSPKIELGLSAEKLGEPILLGNKTVFLIARLLDSLTQLAGALSQMSETQLQIAIPKIIESSTKLKELCPTLRADLTNLLSQVTYTK